MKIKNTKMKLVAVTALTGILALSMFAGCGKSSQAEKVTIAGSTSVQPLSEELASVYNETAPDVTIDVQGGGSGQAAPALKDGIADIGALSREVKDEEKADIPKEYVIAKDGVVVITNSDVGVKDLKIEQIKEIFNGKIKNWKEVGGADKKITVVSREEGSGTRGAFTELTGVLEKDDAGNELDGTRADALVQASTGAVVETVATTPDSIGYASMEAVNDTVASIKVEGVSASEATVLDGSYKISRPFIYGVGAEVSTAAQAFIDWVMGADGQAAIKEQGYVPVQ
ncbi:MAG: phosphate ABC transporter substrate-binding protein [Anaerovoracaceae bacterium]